MGDKLYFLKHPKITVVGYISHYIPMKYPSLDPVVVEAWISGLNFSLGRGAGTFVHLQIGDLSDAEHRRTACVYVCVCESAAYT